MSDENLVGYCGLYCGDCPNYTGVIADLARDLRKELRKNKFELVAENIPFKELKSYPECYECLGAMVKLRCKGCKTGRANFCNIGKCAVKKDIDGCWECDEFESCDKFEFLKPIHGEANLKNLRKIKKDGIEVFITGKRYW